MSDDQDLTEEEIAKLQEILERNQETGANEYTMPTEYNPVDLD